MAFGRLVRIASFESIPSSSGSYSRILRVIVTTASTSIPRSHRADLDVACRVLQRHKKYVSREQQSGGSHNVSSYFECGHKSQPPSRFKSSNFDAGISVAVGSRKRVFPVIPNFHISEPSQFSIGHLKTIRLGRWVLLHRHGPTICKGRRASTARVNSSFSSHRACPPSS
jgi:hypothetical protein